MPPIELNLRHAGFLGHLNSTISNKELQNIKDATERKQVTSTWGAIKDWFCDTKKEAAKLALFDLVQAKANIESETEVEKNSRAVLHNYNVLSTLVSDTYRPKLKFQSFPGQNTANIEIEDTGISVNVNILSDAESKGKLMIFPGYQISQTPDESSKFGDCVHYRLDVRLADGTRLSYKKLDAEIINTIKYDLALNAEQVKNLEQLASSKYPLDHSKSSESSKTQYVISVEISQLKKTSDLYDADIAITVQHDKITSEAGFPFGGYVECTPLINEHFIVSKDKLISTGSYSDVEIINKALIADTKAVENNTLAGGDHRILDSVLNHLKRT